MKRNRMSALSLLLLVLFVTAWDACDQETAEEATEELQQMSNDELMNRTNILAAAVSELQMEVENLRAGMELLTSSVPDHTHPAWELDLPSGVPDHRHSTFDIDFLKREMQKVIEETPVPYHIYY
jgi:hypothetical protein